MSKRVSVLNMVLVDTRPFNGFLKDLLNLKSMLLLFILFKQITLLDKFLFIDSEWFWFFSFILLNRFEGPRNAEALAEYVNKEGGMIVAKLVSLRIIDIYFCGKLVLSWFLT